MGWIGEEWAGWWGGVRIGRDLSLQGSLRGAVVGNSGFVQKGGLLGLGKRIGSISDFGCRLWLLAHLYGLETHWRCHALAPVGALA